MADKPLHLYDEATSLTASDLLVKGDPVTGKLYKITTLNAYTAFPERLSRVAVDGSDVTAGLQAEITACANSQRLVLRPGTILLTGVVTVPSGVDLWAAGTTGQKVGTTAAGTTIVCQGSGQLVFEGGGGLSGNFRCLGSTNTGPLVVFGTGCNSRTFMGITGSQSANDSFHLRGAQNCAFISLYSENIVGNALVLDTRPDIAMGAAGNRFYSFESTGVNGWHIVNRQTDLGGSAPVNNWIIGGIAERATGSTTLQGLIDMQAGDLDLSGFIGSSGSGTGTVLTAGLRVTDATLRIHGDCEFNATVGETSPGVLQTNATVGVNGRMVMRGWVTAWQHNGGLIQCLGQIEYTNVTTRWAFSGGSLNTILGRLSRPLAVVGLETNDARVLEGFVYGETNPRVRLSPTGLVFGPGGATAPTQFAEVVMQNTVTATATLTVVPSQQSLYTITAQNQALTIAAPSAGAIDGQRIMLRILDNGTSRAITWNAAWVPIGVTLPTATTVNKWLYVEARYYAAGTVWHVYDVRTQA